MGIVGVEEMLPWGVSSGEKTIVGPIETFKYYKSEAEIADPIRTVLTTLSRLTKSLYARVTE